MKGQTPNRRVVGDQRTDPHRDNANDQKTISTNQGYTEFFSWGNDEMG